MSIIWQEHDFETEERLERLSHLQTPLWLDCALWLGGASLIAAVWIVVVKVW